MFSPIKICSYSLATTIADAAGMMYSIYVTSVAVRAPLSSTVMRYNVALLELVDFFVRYRQFAIRYGGSHAPSFRAGYITLGIITFSYSMTRFDKIEEVVLFVNL